MHRERAGQRPSQWHRLAPSTQQTQSARRSRTKWESLGAAERSGMLAHVFGREEQQSLAVDSRVLEGLLQLCQANRAEPVPAATLQLSDPKQTSKQASKQTSEQTNKQTNKQTNSDGKTSAFAAAAPHVECRPCADGLDEVRGGRQSRECEEPTPRASGDSTLHTHTADADMRTRTHTRAFSLPHQRVHSRFVAQRGTAQHSAAAPRSAAQRSTTFEAVRSPDGPRAQWRLTDERLRTTNACAPRLRQVSESGCMLYDLMLHVAAARRTR
jgi:hypothetical protein